MRNSKAPAEMLFLRKVRINNFKKKVLWIETASNEVQCYLLQLETGFWCNVPVPLHIYMYIVIIIIIILL